jgi:hypothetical protein
MLSTRDIALYAAIIATINGIWNLYAGVFLDRARLRVRVYETWLITPGSNSPNIPTLTLTVSNRGRRSVTVQTISRVVNPRKQVGRELSRDFVMQGSRRLGRARGTASFTGPTAATSMGRCR